MSCCKSLDSRKVERHRILSKFNLEKGWWSCKRMTKDAGITKEYSVECSSGDGLKLSFSLELAVEHGIQVT